MRSLLGCNAAHFELNLYPWSVKSDLEKLGSSDIKMRETIAPTIKEVVTSEMMSELPPEAATAPRNFSNLEEYLSSHVGALAVQGLKDVLELSVKDRVAAQPPFCKDCIRNEVCTSTHAGIGRKRGSSGEMVSSCPHSKVVKKKLFFF